MKKIALSLLLLPCFFFAHAQNVIVVQSGTNTSVFSTLDSAMAAASPGDYLYLSAGNFTAVGNGTGNGFYKPLHFIGAGISPDSTNTTGLTTISAGSGIYVAQTAAGSTFDGIDFSNALLYFSTLTPASGGIPDTLGSFSFNRCIISYVNGGFSNVYPNATTSWAFHECIFTGPAYIGLGSAQNASAIFDRCFLHSIYAAQRCVFNNCIIGDPGNVNTMNNCIVYGAAAGASAQGAGHYNNCIFSGANNSVNASNCQFNVSLSSVFVNAPSVASNPYWDFNSNYHMAASSPGINAGNDGHDCGIFGTSTPTKAGWVPYNPHFSKITIPTSTDASGILNVNINVAAQSH